MIRYFAYGSALSKRHVHEWASEHGVDEAPFAAGVPAVLRGYELVFDVESRFWGGRVADLRPSDDAVVHGVLFELDDGALEAVRRKEGVPTGLSEEIEIEVQQGGASVAAKAYVGRPERRTTPGAPAPRLLAALIEGAIERGLPEPWISRLRSQGSTSGPSPADATTNRIRLGSPRKP